jgi:serine/threonine-protein kinase
MGADVVDEEPTDSGGMSGMRADARLGHYRLRRLLGKGGFGCVWEAEDTVMDRLVALKVLRSEYSENETFRQRLFREARAAGRLHEPHVVPIHRCGEIDGQLYIDMRLIDGNGLEAVLSQEGPLAPARAVAVVRQIAAALDAAHSAGLIHRDVKPANILLADDDFACLLDFGLANAASDAKLTSTGFTMGTFAYMAPERLSADAEIDRRVDVYALACVLYECLTGSQPYSGDIPALISAHHTAAIPRPSQNRPGIPAAFDDVIALGMAKSAEDRYGSAGALAIATHKALTTAGQDQADTILAGTQAATLPPVDMAITLAAPAPSQPTAPSSSTPDISASPGVASRPGRRKAIIFLGLTATAVIIAGLIAVLGHRLPLAGTPHPLQVQLPFTGLYFPASVAVDTAGDVYVTDAGNRRVVKLPAGSTNQVELPFTGLNNLESVAVDTVGNVYITDVGANPRVLRLPAGSTTQTELSITPRLVAPMGIAVNSAGDLYITDNGKVLKIPAAQIGSPTTPVELPFSGVEFPVGVAVDTADNVYVTDRNLHTGFKWSADSNTQLDLRFRLRDPRGVAVDTAGNVYVADHGNNEVLKLPTGSNSQQVDLPFTGLGHPSSVAVDTAGNVYIADSLNDRVLKHPAR